MELIGKIQRKFFRLFEKYSKYNWKNSDLNFSKSVLSFSSY